MWKSRAKVSLLKYRGRATHKHKSHPSGTLLRLNPTNDSETSLELPNDVTVNISAEHNGFSHVSYNSLQGWIRSEYLTALPTTYPSIPLRFLNINMSWGNPNGSEKPMILRCQKMKKQHFFELAAYLKENVDIATVQEVASWSPLFNLLDDFYHYHCATNQVSCIVRKTVGSWRQIEFPKSQYIKGLRGVCVIHSDAYDCTIASVWFDHEYSRGTKKRQFLSHVLSYLPKTSRIILGMDANDDKGILNNNFAYKGIRLYNKSLNMNTCCEDAHYSMPGDYIFDTKELGACEYMVPFEQKYNQCYGDHLGLFYKTFLS